MKSINDTLNNLKLKIPAVVKTAFFAAVIVGLLTHAVIMVSDFPNHDGLGSLYFDQNMITSGRWFLGTACGISTYFSIPWVIGVLSLIYIGIASGLMVSVLEVKSKLSAGVIGAMMATFPALASTFAYVFTMDGYMIGLVLAVLAVLLTKRSKWGWILGAVSLAFSMGTYQAYLPVAIVLSMYCVVFVAVGGGSIKSKLLTALRFLYMGIFGAGLYYVLLQILLKIQGKVLDTYQGINGLESSMSAGSILSVIPGMYKDFVKFSIGSKILVPNVIAAIAFVLLGLAFIFVFIKTMINRKWHKSIWMYIIIVVFMAVLPLAMNVVMIISSGVNYHLIMRYQWVLIPVLLVAFCDRFGDFNSVKSGKLRNALAVVSWAMALSGIVISFCYVLVDNIGYSNLAKKYEKTYGYCERLLDRIEQTDGYYEGIPIAIIGVVGSEPYPETDITGDVTGNMIGLSGDYLLYMPDNYETFIKNYLGATLNFLSVEEVTDIYYSPEYRAMESFPGKTSTQVVNGILYIKTENKDLVLED